MSTAIRWLAALTLLGSAAAPAAVVLSEVTPLGALSRSSLRVGDVVLACRAGMQEIEVVEPIDLAICEWEFASQPLVLMLEVEREGEIALVSVAAGAWRYRAVPRLAEEHLSLYRSGLATARSAESAAGSESHTPRPWLELEEQLLREGRSDLLFWLFAEEAHSPQRWRGAGVDSWLDEATPRREVRRFAAATARARAARVRADLEEEAQAARSAAELAAALEEWPRVELRWRLEAAINMGLSGQNLEADRSLATLSNELAAVNSPLMHAIATTHRAGLALSRSDLEAAEQLLAAAQPLFQASDPDHAEHGWSLNRLGILALRKGEPTLAVQSFQQANEIFERRGYGHWQPLSNAANALESLGEYESAVEHSRRALSKVVVGSMEEGVVRGNLAYTYTSWWRLAEARVEALRSHELLERRGAPMARLAKSHARLGHIARFSGDLSTAEQHYLQALELYRTIGDASGTAAHLSNLGNLARQRKDFEAALAYYQQALDGESLSPTADLRGRTLSNYGRTLLLLGRSARARPLLEESLRIKERESPISQDVAASLMLLGDLERHDGDLELARSRYRAALEMHTALTPGRQPEAENQIRLARLELEAGDVSVARELLERAVATLEERAPGTTLAADAYHQRGRLEALEGRPADASRWFCAATDALDEQWSRLGASLDSGLTFLDAHADYYRRCVDSLVQRNELQAALEIQLRARSKVLLDMLQQRAVDIDLTGREVVLQGRLEALSVRRQELLGQLRAEVTAEELAALRSRLAELRIEHERLAASIRRDQPRLAAVSLAERTSLRELNPILDTKTLAIVFMVDESSTLVFSLRHPDRSNELPVLRVERSAIGRTVLAEQVEDFRNAIADARDPGRVQEVGQRLYEKLLAPLTPEIQRAERLILVLDGPLHRLPFAALSDRGEFLVQRVGLQVVPSLENLLRLERRASNYRGAAVFADPARSPDAVVGNGEGELGELPGSRREAERLAQLLPRPLRTYVGSQATEERVKSTLRDEQVIHFAGHAVLDQRLPLNSAILLGSDGATEESRASGEDGWLHAWEVVEALRLETSLVTLAGCETALGQESSGEGLLGLAWSFQLAGAKSVVASLWKVGDESTATLMESFYRELSRGRNKAAALRNAQLAMIEGDGYQDRRSKVTARSVGGLRDASSTAESSHPWHWAAFQLYGSAEP